LTAARRRVVRLDSMLDSPPLQKWLKLALVEKRSAREHIEALRQAAASSFEFFP
jgi:hypothetical protein